MNKCSGCGVELQSDAKEKIGYVAKSALDKEQVLCMRCFNIKNYTKNIAKDYTDEQFVDILKNISTSNLVVMIVDVFDLNSTLLPDLIKEFTHHDILLFVNKADMLPVDINALKLLNSIVKMYQDLGLNILNGALISAKYNFNIDYANELIGEYNRGRDIYIVGVSNVGKSQFINALLQECQIPNEMITISHFPATTIDVLKFEYFDNYIYDTPGVINRSQIIHYINEEDIKFLYPKKLKQHVYQLNEGSTIFVAGYLQIDVLTKTRTSFTLYCSDQLPIHRRKTLGVEEFVEVHSDDILKYLYTDRFESVSSSIYTLDKDDEVVINGLGWFKVNADVDIRISLNSNVGVSVRNKLL